MKIFECEQYSAEWWNLRRGVPTASEFGCILTPKTMKYSAAAETYICRLLGDLADIDYPRPQMASLPMQRGTAQEQESRDWYALETGATVRQVGFCRDDSDRFGCSPDGLVDGDGILELKNPLPATQVAYLFAGSGLPPEYRAQVHGQLIVTRRAWVDFVSYCPGLPALLVRVVPDEYTAALGVALEQFWDRLEKAKLFLTNLVCA